MFFHPFSTFLGIPENGHWDIADMEAVAAPLFMARHHDQLVAEAEGRRDVAGAHGENTLEIQILGSSDFLMGKRG